MRSLLFVPGSRPDRFDKAAGAGADAIIFDLEDAVAPHEKNSAREAIRSWVSPERTALVRVNGAGTSWHAEDLALASLPGVIAIVVPKAESSSDVIDVMRAGASYVLPLIETAAGIAAASEIANTPGVARLAFGSIDFQIDMAMRDALEDELLFFRSQLILASRLAGIASPIDGVTVSINDTEQLRADVVRASRLGFGGKLCIHPKQIDAVNTGFSPDAQSIAWARRVIVAAKEGGVTAVDGKMVDRPVLLRAEAILRDAQL